MKSLPWRNALYAAVAFLSLTLIAIRAYTDWDTNWDSLAYHIPFAARIAGICDISCLRMTPGLETDFKSFPLAVNALQGILWKITGKAEAANFVSLSSLVLLIAYLWRYWSVPWGIATLGLLAVPFVQIFAAGMLIDLITNSAATICTLTLFGILIQPEKMSRGRQLTFFGSVVFLGNSKPQMMPVAFLFGVLFIFMMHFCVSKMQRSTRLLWQTGWRESLLSVALLLLLSATAIKNIVLFGNPVYPVIIKFVGVVLFQGLVDPASSNPGPNYLQSFPGPVRWLFSVLEVGAYDGRWTPWTAGQGDVPIEGHAMRMGGYFVPYVLANLGFLAFAIKRLWRSQGRKILMFVVGLSIIVSALPAAFELRYYMFWFLSIIAINCYLYFSRNLPEYSDRIVISRLFELIICVCFLSVVSLSSARWILGTNRDSQSVLTAYDIDNKVQTKIMDGDIVCVSDMRQATLYAPFFHAGRHYSIIQSDSDPRCNKNI